MAVTRFQATVLRRIAHSRIASGETYIAGGLALNHQLNAPRVSHDIYVFNDSAEALQAAYASDCAALRDAGFEVKERRQSPFFIEVTVSGTSGEATNIQWVRDSAFRFFPLVEDELLGLTLHPFDLATNKLLALMGREVPRDWVDTITCHAKLQPLPYLAWAACGKDLGYNPAFILDLAMRVRYVQVELDSFVESEEKLDAAVLCRKWHEMVIAARDTIRLLPAEEAGKAVMTREGGLFKGTDDEFRAALAAGGIVFHEGHLGGAWPQIVQR